jgi:hypothetical protein
LYQFCTKSTHIIDGRHCSPALRIKFSAVPFLNLFRFGPCLSVTLFHTTHCQVLQIHRCDKNVSTTHIVLYKFENVTKILSFNFEYFWVNHRETHLSYTSIFSAFLLFGLRFRLLCVWLSTSWCYMQPEDASNHGVLSGTR